MALPAAYRVTNAEALEVACKQCGAKIGDGCVYVPVIPRRSGYSLKQRALLDRVGQPTKRPHGRRLQAAWDRLARQRRRELQLQNWVPPHTREAARAMHDFDLAEYRSLVAWFAQNGKMIADAAASNEKAPRSVMGRVAIPAAPDLYVESDLITACHCQRPGYCNQCCCVDQGHRPDRRVGAGGKKREGTCKTCAHASGCDEGRGEV